MSDDTSDETLKTVVLNDRHIAAGGRMVPFSGYALPVQYPTGIMAEHKWTREHAGLFDVSHMGPSFLTLAERSGDDAKDHAAIAALIEPLICGDIAGLAPGQIRYTLLLNQAGGTLDDLMVARSPRFAGALYIVVNAGTKEGDFARIAAAAGSRAAFRRVDDNALLALQGPEAVAVLEALVPGVAELAFMHYAPFAWGEEQLIISRSGYTGEDGYEILCSPKHAPALWDALLADERVKPIGLGARDSLRLEAGLPLHGHDIDPTTSPVEGALTFALSKSRKEAANFNGAERVLRELADGPARVRVGLHVKEGAPAREGAEIADLTGAVIGKVTSGGPSPTLGKNIAMGFVPPSHAALGTALQVIVRGKAAAAEVVAMPFIAQRYHRKPKS